MTDPARSVDPDVDLHIPGQRRELSPSPWPVLVAVSAGGVLGALARYGLAEAVPRPPGGFPWATFAANLSGCLLIGVLMALVDQVWSGRRLIRPFLGVGVLGGYTTFSTYVVDTQRTVADGAPGTALLYLAATMAGALLAVWAGTAATGAALARRSRPADQERYAVAGQARETGR
ncbi:CrcB family protein [Phytohabitans sp. ZYX-F-186]|uniref:Fluoride-specific ion channel FluC n=1 Tax=Phytohabitans maris TaxID=3071409 RepID=A0ABU0ZCG3_9ACTN|nr:CrcB family protein [Phytohabitans sp. ZYX-F-186]MDQ7904022.1 CrcB family protein [Phytohabitans sp. ZYX-F-186]